MYYYKRINVHNTRPDVSALYELFTLKFVERANRTFKTSPGRAIYSFPTSTDVSRVWIFGCRNETIVERDFSRIRDPDRSARASIFPRFYFTETDSNR